ncbi:MAG: hypothetical protein LBN00_10495 [Oscillospiraceae bacterium]|nr:hypothetical protein [Oscillospiraceae bacterium]
MKPREFAYNGEPIPKLDTRENADFVLLFQKGMLLSLVKRGLLTAAQMDSVMTNLERKYRKKP